MSPKAAYRISRHFLLILALYAVSFNQTYMGFMEYSSLLGSNLYLSALFILITYLMEGYFNMYVLIPKLFLKEKYTIYFTFFSIMVLFFVVIHYGLEYSVFRLYNLEPGIYSFFKKQGASFALEFFASYFVDYIAVLGAGLTVILKQWLLNNKQVHHLEKVHIQTELEKLKEQVNPQFLFSTLHKIGDTAPRDQRKASNMLMELSGILRYQLYDCNREKVLLNAEIQFINTYLQIEKLCYNKMDFEIETEGDINGIFVPPLLFIPLVQSSVKNMQEEGNYFNMQLYFQSGNDFIAFYCDCKDADLLLSPGLEKIKKRLKSIYNDKHVLRIEPREDEEYYSIYLLIRH